VRASYDPKTDTLSLVLKEGVAIAESDEGNPGVILDYDERGDLVSMEILDASRRVTDAKKMEFQIAWRCGRHVATLRLHSSRGPLVNWLGQSDVRYRRRFLSTELTRQVRFCQP
jgi:uncharacterized protein YuzE